MSFLFVLFITGGIMTTAYEPPKLKNEDCEDCSKLIDKAMIQFSDKIKGIEPFEIEGEFGMCQSCGVSHAYTGRRGGDCCAETLQDPAGKSFLKQTMRMHFDELIAQCKCTITQPGFPPKKISANVTTTWTNAHAIADIGFYESHAEALRGDIDCDNPMPACQIEDKYLKIQCETGSSLGNAECDALKKPMISVMETVAKTVVPNFLTKEINEDLAVSTLFKCDEM